MADQAINALSTKTAPETSDQLLLVGTGEPQLIDYDKLADAILNKITSKKYALDAGQMTLLAALNKLNSDKVSGHSKMLNKNETWTLNISYNCILMFSPVNDGFVVVIVSSNEYHCVYGENSVSTASISAVNNVIKITNLIDWPVCFNLIGT